MPQAHELAPQSLVLRTEGWRAEALLAAEQTSKAAPRGRFPRQHALTPLASSARAAAR